MAKVFLHIGAHKTASTFIQSGLKKNLTCLDGVLSIVFREELAKTGFYRNLKRSASLPDPSLAALDSDRLELVETQSSAPVTLITSEDMLSGLDMPSFFYQAPRRLQYIDSFFRDTDVHFILYTRTQTEYIESVYLQQLHMGQLQPFSDFLGSDIPKNISWLSLCESIVKRFGSQAIEVRPYELIKQNGPTAFFRDFLSIVIPAKKHLISSMTPQSENRSANRSFSAKAIEIFEKLHPILDQDEVRKLRYFLQTHFSTAHYPRAKLLSDEQSASIRAYYRQENDDLFRLFMPKYSTCAKQYV